MFWFGSIKQKKSYHKRCKRLYTEAFLLMKVKQVLKRGHGFLNTPAQKICVWCFCSTLFLNYEHFFLIFFFFNFLLSLFFSVKHFPTSSFQVNKGLNKNDKLSIYGCKTVFLCVSQNTYKIKTKPNTRSVKVSPYSYGWFCIVGLIWASFTFENSDRRFQR